jgi:hypothetical protein
MNTNALILMITTHAVVTAITVWFFWKVLTTPSKPEPDSYSENDDEQRDE